MLLSLPGIPGAAVAFDVAGWKIECIDCPKSFGGMTDRHLRLDAAGNPHVAYGGDNLYYARYDAGARAWVFETADPAPGVGSSASLAFDAQGRPHIAYHDTAAGCLKYAWRDVGGWHSEVADDPPSGSAGSYTSIALEADGTPHISYAYMNLTFNISQVRHAYRRAGVWQVDTVEYDDAGGPTSLALDSQGYPRFSYQDLANYRLKYAYQDAGGWHLEVADSRTGSGDYSSLVLLPSGQPAIAYRTNTAGLRWTVRGAAGWTSQQVDGDTSVEVFVSVALDSSGYPHASYYVWPNDALRYAYQDAAGWHKENVDAGKYVGVSTSLALDGSNRPRISYFDRTNGKLKHAFRDAGAWQKAVVDTGGSVGAYSSLKVNAAGEPSVSYPARGGLQVARRSTSRRLASGWQSETVDSGPFVGEHTSLALSSAGRPHVSYYDATNRCLKYATWNGTTWQREIVGGTASYFGQYNSLALDAADLPRISGYFQDSDDLKLRVSRRQQMDDPDRGQHRPGGHPHIAGAGWERQPAHQLLRLQQPGLEVRHLVLAQPGSARLWRAPDMWASTRRWPSGRADTLTSVTSASHNLT